MVQGASKKMRDPKTGAIIRGRFMTLKLDELSAVDMPAQEGAQAVIMKRASADHPILKYVCTEDGAKTFVEVLAATEAERKHWAANDKIWPVINAVTDSIRSIIGDSKIGWATKQTMLRETVEGFIAEVNEKAPEIEAELTKYLDEGVIKMSDIEKKLEAAEAALAKAQTDIADLTKARDEAVAKAKESDDETKDAKEKFENLKKSGDDEILKVGDAEVRKSVVGDAQFAIFKAQQSEVAKLNDNLLMATLEKRADAEMGSLPGTSIEKAAILKHVAGMPEDVKKSFDTIITAAQKMADAGFTELGHQDVSKMQDIAKAKASYMEKVRDVAKRDSIPEFQAMQKARDENPELFKAYREAEDANKVAA